MMNHLRRPRNQRGAALVEFAIIAPVLFALVFGMVDFGFIFNDYLTVRGGVQSAARVGAVGNVGSNSTCTLNSATPGTSTDAIKLMCLTKDRIGLDATKTAVNVLAVDTTAAHAAAYADGTEIVICAMYPATSRTKMMAPFVSGKNVTTRVVVRVETTTKEKDSTDPGDMANTAETPLSGSNWNFCTG